MLLVYDRTTGEVLDNTGTNSAMPNGPEGDLAFVNTDAQGIPRAQLALFRLHDIDDADLVAQALSHQVHVDVTRTELLIGNPLPEPTVEEPEPSPEQQQIASLQEQVDALTDLVLMQQEGMI